MGTQRILRGAAATLTYVNCDADGLAADASGAVTVGVVRADGTVLIADGTAAAHGATGVYTVALTPAQTATLDTLTATWTIGGLTAAARTTDHVVVGGYMFSIGELRTSQPGLEDDTTWPNTKVIEARAFVEDEAEWICDRAFVPRYARVVLNGSGESTLLTKINDIRSVRALRISSAPGSSTVTTLTATQLGQLTWSDTGELRRNDGAVFPSGYGTIVVELEHGLTAPKDDMRTAAMQRCADVMRDPNSPVPDRGSRYERADGWQFDLKSEGDAFATGIDDVDRVYGRYSLRKRPGGAGAAGGAGSTDRPASRALTFEPQYGSLYRGYR